MSTKKNTVTCSFIMDRDIYNAYKSIVVMNGENVKENLVKYMKSVIEYGSKKKAAFLCNEYYKSCKTSGGHRAFYTL